MIQDENHRSIFISLFHKQLDVFNRKRKETSNFGIIYAHNLSKISDPEEI